MPVHPNTEPTLKATNAGIDAMVQLSGFEWLMLGALIAVLLALAAALLMYGLQRHMLFPASKPLDVPHSPHHLIRAVDIPVNGKVLRGHVAIPTREPGVRQGLLYFNGRRENPRSIFRALAALPGHHVLCFSYDRLGLAWRKPGERELMADNLAVLDWWASECGIAIEHIAVAGRSLGSGFAVQAAAARPVRRLALISPFDQLLTAVRRSMPWVPRWWLRDKFDSRDHIGQVRCACLLIVGDEDTTIPAAASRALFDSWTGRLSEFVVRQSGHRGVLKRADVHQALADFLRG